MSKSGSDNMTNLTRCFPSDFIDGEHKVPITFKAGKAFYAYFTPVILIVGILGNSLSLKVFTSKKMRRLCASTYLAALSVSDLLTLLFYVLVEWLRRGLVYFVSEGHVAFLDYNGICQIQLYLAYVSRFISAWVVVAFTIERYIGVCLPLRRKDICTTRSTRKLLASICIVAILSTTYKPFLSGVYSSGDHAKQYCTSNPIYGFTAFVLDSIFAVLITFVPFLIITILNILIMRKLFVRNKKYKEYVTYYKTEESVIKLEFTIILLTISFCFIAFNLPYFSVWFRNFLKSKYITNHQMELSYNNIEFWQGVLEITRTIFYMNYCINFFLYNITGTYFRRQIKSLFSFKTNTFRRSRRRSSRYNSNTSPTCVQSWV